jgi:hypothetical protein
MLHHKRWTASPTGAVLASLALALLMSGGCELLDVQPADDPVPTSLQVVGSRDAQTGAPGSPLPLPIQVRILDENGHTYTDAPVQVVWEVLTGGGSVDPDTSSSGDSGRASTVWSLGPMPGGQSVQASAPGLGSVTFTATATALAASDSLVVGTATAVGDTARVDVRLVTGESAAALQFRLTFSDSLSVEAVSATARLDTMSVAWDGEDGLSVVVYPEVTDPLPTIGAGTAPVLSVLFRLAPGTPSGTYELLVNQAAVSDDMGQVTALAAAHGSVVKLP